MKISFKITCATFTIWILTSFINSLFFASYSFIIHPTLNGLALETILVFFITLFFSVPGFFIFWLILLTKSAYRIYERALFRVALSTVIILASITAIICSLVLRSAFPGDVYALMLIPVVSSVVSVMMHFNYFKKINN